MLIFIRMDNHAHSRDMDSNTSHVNLYQTLRSAADIAVLHSNTSHVNLYLLPV